MNCGVGHRRGLDLALLWLRCGLAAVTPIRSLAWEPPYAVSVATKKSRKENKKTSEERPRPLTGTPKRESTLNRWFLLWVFLVSLAEPGERAELRHAQGWS